MPSINQSEFSVFSQNGEDGVIRLLATGLKAPDRTFVEIGTSDGRQNNTASLLMEGFRGLGVDANEQCIARYEARLRGTDLAARVALKASRVGWHNCSHLVLGHGDKAPDFFSLDIDGIDYYVAYRLLRDGFRPKIVCCEYNAFLEDRPLTVVYDEQFSRYRYDPQHGLYFGASVGAWKHLFSGYGYRFCGVESSGVNAFFCLEAAFAPGFLASITGLPHQYARVFVDKYRVAGNLLAQELMARTDLVFVDVSKERVEERVASE